MALFSEALRARVDQWRERANKERIIAKRDPGSVTSIKATATSLAYDSAAVELEELLNDEIILEEVKRDNQDMKMDLDLAMERERRLKEQAANYAELRNRLGCDENTPHGEVWRALGTLQSELAATRKQLVSLLIGLEANPVLAEAQPEFLKLLGTKVAEQAKEANLLRNQLAEAQKDNADIHSAAHRVALEAECFYMDCKDMALVSKWDDPLQTAISDVWAIGWDGETSALTAAIAEAVEPYKRDAERWRNLKPYYTAAVFDPEREDGLDLGEGIGLVFVIPRGSRVSANADETIEALAAKEIQNVRP